MLPRLHVLVSELEVRTPRGVAAVERIVERAAPNAVHLRARLTARRRSELGARLAAAARSADGWLVVNGRPDIALAVGARAVQLGRTALGVEETHRLLRACRGRLAIGASVHDSEAAVRAVRAGADYLVLGTIYPSTSHPGVAGIGPGALRATRARLPEGSSTPILAIGGVRAERVGEVLRSGAHGIVVGSAVWGAADPLEAALELQSELGKHAEDTVVDGDGHTDSRER